MLIERHFAHLQMEINTLKAEVDRDVDLGVLERVFYGETTDWCSRMVITRKEDRGLPSRQIRTI